MKKLYKSIVEKYKTNNPEIIAKKMGITIIYNDLGATRGFYSQIMDKHFIHINNKLSDEDKLYTIAHELGHYLLHDQSNLYFLKEKMVNYPINKIELEADVFASYFIVSDEEIKEINNIIAVSQCYGLSQKVCQERIKYMERGEKKTPPLLQE